MRLLKQAGCGDPNALRLAEFVWRFRFYRVRFRDKQARSQRWDLRDRALLFDLGSFRDGDPPASRLIILRAKPMSNCLPR